MSLRAVSKSKTNRTNKHFEGVRNGPDILSAWANVFDASKTRPKIKACCPRSRVSVHSDGRRLAAEVTMLSCPTGLTLNRGLRADGKVDRRLCDQERKDRSLVWEDSVNKDTAKTAAPFLVKTAAPFLAKNAAPFLVKNAAPFVGKTYDYSSLRKHVT